MRASTGCQYGIEICHKCDPLRFRMHLNSQSTEKNYTQMVQFALFQSQVFYDCEINKTYSSSTLSFLVLYNFVNACLTIEQKLSHQVHRLYRVLVRAWWKTIVKWWL